MYSRLFESVIFPVAERFAGSSITRSRKELERTQWLPAREIQTIQEERLRALVRYSYREIPYYHRLMEEHGISPTDIRTLDDISKLPVLRKSDIQMHADELKPAHYPGRARYWSSGGSTAQPVRFLRGLEDYSSSWAAAFRGWGWAGYHPGDRIVTLWGNPAAIHAGMNLKKKVQNLLFRRHLLSAYDMTEESLMEYTRFIRSIKPAFIRGYAQAIVVLARFIETHSIQGIHPAAVLTTAETLFPDQRRYLEGIFKCRVFDGYGGGEAPSAAYECEEHTGYHCTAENLIVEVALDGEPCTPGDPGRILVTNLHSYAMPFIRYDMEDIGTLAEEPCPCGRGLPLLASLEGRVNDLIRTPDGKIVHSYLFPAVFKDQRGVGQFQVVQESPEMILVRIVPDSSAGEPDTDAIVSALKRAIGNAVSFRVETVDEIPLLSGSGKRRFVISRQDQGISPLS